MLVFLGSRLRTWDIRPEVRKMSYIVFGKAQPRD